MEKSNNTQEFKQKMKMPKSGSFFNYLMSNNSTIPKINEYATILHYTDRSVVIVREISECGKKIKVENVSTEHDKTKPGGCGHQNWIHTPAGYFDTIVWFRGKWRKEYNNYDGKIARSPIRILFGTCDYHYDWSF